MTGVLDRIGTGTPDWVMCAGCRTMVYGRRLSRNLLVCPDCGHHHRMGARERIAQLFDEDSVRILDTRVRSRDVLGFTDTRPYPARLAAAREATGLTACVLVARGTVGGYPLMAAVMDFNFLGGSLGGAAGELITRAAELSLRDRVPLLIASASGGARMQEGAVSLMQMAKTATALGRLDEAGILTISLITDPTYGGVAASFATLADVIIAEPGARLGFAGRRVIEQTIRQTLPPTFQTAEFLLEHGLIDMVRPRAELKATLVRLLSHGVASARRPAGSGTGGSDRAIVRDHTLLPAVDPWDAVQRARAIDRPTIAWYLRHAFDDFEELHGDRVGAECPAIVGGLARLDGISVVVVGHHKGRTVADRMAHNYGMATPGGHRKAIRLTRLAAKLRLPVVTLVDTPGAYPGVEAEEQGQAVTIAESIRQFAGLPVPVVALVTGEGGSGGALALAVADEVLVCGHGVYSVISPEGCAAILWKSSAMAPAAAAALRLDARQLLALGVVDGVVPEPDGGNGADHVEAARRVRAALVTALVPLLDVDPASLVARRRARFRSFGTAEPEVAR